MRVKKNKEKNFYFEKNDSIVLLQQKRFDVVIRTSQHVNTNVPGVHERTRTFSFVPWEAPISLKIPR